MGVVFEHDVGGFEITVDEKIIDDGNVADYNLLEELNCLGLSNFSLIPILLPYLNM